MGPEQEGQAPKPAETIPCSLCVEGVMTRTVIRPYNVKLGIVIGVVGLLCMVTHLLLLVGLVLVLVGLYFVGAKKRAWLCGKCGAIISREE